MPNDKNNKLSIKSLLKYFNERKPGTRVEDWNEYFLNIALSLATRSTCLRRNYGALIVKDNVIISTGYNGAPKCHTHCIDKNYCYREEHNIPHGKEYESCVAVHAEQNALIYANGKNLKGSTLYLAGYDCNERKLILAKPCKICKPMLINAGIEKVVSLVEKEGNLFFVTEQY